MIGSGPRPPSRIGRVTPWQLSLLLVTAVAIESSTTGDHWLAWIAGRDMWVCVIAGTVPAVPAVWLLATLAQGRAGESLAGTLRTMLGPLGCALACAYAGLFLLAASMAARLYGVFDSALGFGQVTPAWAVVVPLVALSVYSAVVGIEVLARINVVVLLFADVPLGLLLTGLSLNHQRLALLRPVLAHGAGPVLVGAQFMLGLFGRYVLLMVYAPYVDRREGLLRPLLWSVGLVGVMSLGHALGPVLTFGNAVRDFVWPLYSQTRAIEAGRFIQDVDVFVVLFWTHGLWVETALFLHAASITAAEVFGWRSHRPALVCMGVAVAAGALLLPANQMVAFQWRWKLEADGLLAFGLGVPSLLLGLTVASRAVRAIRVR